jgi:site-specific recombinase XerD
MTGANKISLAECKTRALPVALWPAADGGAWVEACQAPTRLKPGGSAGHLRSATRDNYAERYACFLGFLRRRGLLQSEGVPAANVTPDKVDAYLADLKDRVASTTMYGLIATLRLVAQIIAPGGDFRWLSEIEKDLALVKRPRSKSDRVVLAEVLIRAGLTLMHEAELSQTMTDLGRACQFRNGLIIALLGFCPIRRKNFSALEIGRSFVKIRRKWWIVLSASETKEKRADERPVDKLLTPFIERYLSHYRPVLVRSDNRHSALWLSANDGTPITANHLTHLINAVTLSTVGVAVSPHLFRTAVASTAAIYGGENPYLGGALLHHTDSNLINEHYNRASSLSAAENFRQIVRQYETKPRGAATPYGRCQK